MGSPATIAAIATAPGRAGIGIVRVSGKELAGLVHAVTGRQLEARQAALVPFNDASGVAIDRGIALYFPAPHSYTGEDVLELHGHGGPVVLRLLLQRCLELGARLAEPGEFTQRAFLNGKIDLVQAESVIDLIEATTARAAKSAMRSLEGDFSSTIQSLAVQLIELRAFLEATLDFPEEDVDPLDREHFRVRLVGLRGTLETIFEAARQGSLLREGIHVALAGVPNVGKSSLLNRLAGEDLAIVTDIPGTTRDPVRQAIEISGVPMHIVDTAGLRDSNDPVERIGIERAWNAIEKADVLLHVMDARRPEPGDYSAVLERLPGHVPTIQVMNKIDLAGLDAAIEHASNGNTVWLSAKTGAGVELLRQALLAAAGWQAEPEAIYLARERHLNALRVTKDHLASIAPDQPPELAAEHLRRAHGALASITGDFTADDLLGEIFRRFCLGK